MPSPNEHKTVQARILAYAEAIGWSIVSREEAEQRRGFDPEVPAADRARNRSLFFDDLLDAKVREFPVQRVLNRRERRERKEDLDSFSSLCSLRLVMSATTCCRILTSSELS